MNFKKCTSKVKGYYYYCTCCNKKFSDTIMRVYEIGAYKTFILCKDCENQLNNVSKVDGVKKVISVDNNIYY